MSRRRKKLAESAEADLGAHGKGLGRLGEFETRRSVSGARGDDADSKVDTRRLSLRNATLRLVEGDTLTAKEVLLLLVVYGLLVCVVTWIAIDFSYWIGGT